METSHSFQYLMAESGPADHAEGQGRDPRRLPPHLSTAGLLKTSLPFGIKPEGQSTVRHLPHKAAHRISELNLFLYLRISGVSLCGLVLVGFTLTTEPFRVGSCLMASGLIPSQENPTTEVTVVPLDGEICSNLGSMKGVKEEEDLCFWSVLLAD